MMYSATKQQVSNRGIAPDGFLDELVAWGRDADSSLFVEYSNDDDVWTKVRRVLGPYEDLRHRRAVMLEVMRVLAGYESSWNWNQGTDAHADKVARDAGNPRRPEQIEAGAFQVSADSMNLGIELKIMVLTEVGSTGAREFQRAMKDNHTLAMDYVAQLLISTVSQNGPLLDERQGMYGYLKRDAVAEFRGFLFPAAKSP
jgi:hypothetical protein